MKIHAAELREIRLRLRSAFEISGGSRQDRRVLLIRLEGEGEEGWGECVAAEDPFYSSETTETAWHVLTEFLLPAFVGGEHLGPEAIAGSLQRVRGHRMAKAGVEMAAWDLQARLQGVPLWELLGGDGERVPVGVSLGLQPDDDTLHRKVREARDEGYRRVKLKIKPGRDVEMVSRVREAFPDLPLMVDANAAYTLEDLPRLRELDGLDLMMVEQPLAHDDLRDHARLQSELETPVCLDESIRNVGDAELALELGSCRIVNIKPGRVGGFASARAIHDVCRARDVPVWCGGMLESGVGRAHNVALATLPGFTLPGDISASRRYWERDIVDPEFEVEDGHVAAPEGVGLGVRVDRERVEALTERVERFGGGGRNPAI